MRFIGIVALSVLGLASCATPWDEISTGMGALIGQPAEAAFSQLGMPTAETTIAGQKAYVWSTSYSMPMPVSSTSTTAGTVGSTPYTGQTVGTNWVTGEYDCTIRIFVDESNVIRRWDADGNVGGCEAYGQALRRAAR